MLQVDKLKGVFNLRYEFKKYQFIYKLKILKLYCMDNYLSNAKILVYLDNDKTARIGYNAYYKKFLINLYDNEKDRNLLKHISVDTASEVYTLIKYSDIL